MVWDKFIDGMVTLQIKYRFFSYSTASPAGEHYNFPEWYWTSFRTVGHEEGDLYGRVLFPIPAESCLETGRYVLE